MGCFNSACMATGLPIFSGDAVYAVPLIENYMPFSGLTHERKFTLPVYGVDQYAPYWFPVKSKYNHYGCIEEETKETWTDRLLVEKVNKLKAAGKLVVRDRDAYEYKLVNRKPFESCYDLFHEMLQHEIAYGDEKGFAILGFGFIRADAYKAFQSVWKTACTDSTFLNDLEKDADHYLELRQKIARLNKKIPEPGCSERTKEQDEELFRSWPWSSYGSECKLLKYEGKYHNNYSWYFARNEYTGWNFKFDDWMCDHADEITPEQWVEFRKASCDFLRVILAFVWGGKVWIPPPGTGQHHDVDVAIKLHKINTTILARMKKKIDDDQ